MTVDRPLCYVASPMGFTAAGRQYYESTLLPALAEVVRPVDPWSLTSPDEWVAAERDNRENELARTVGRRNSEAIRTCNLVVAVLDGQEIDSGTAAEVGYATALGLTCFGLRSDLRVSGEPGTSVSLQVESFIHESGGRIFRQLGALIDQLRGAPHVMG